MSYVSNDHFKEVESTYLRTRDYEDFEPLYLDICNLSSFLIKQYAGRNGIYFDIDEIDKKSHDVATRIFNLYIKNTEFSILNLSGYLFYEVKHILVADKKHEMNREDFDECDTIEVSSPEETLLKKVDIIERIDNLANDEDFIKLSDSLWKSKYFKNCIKDISDYKTREWLYDNIETLSYIHNQILIVKENK